VHITCGASNVSFGLPTRKLLHEIYLMMLLGRGSDTAIVDPCNPGLMARITAAEALIGRDALCDALSAGIPCRQAGRAKLRVFQRPVHFPNLSMLEKGRVCAWAFGSFIITQEDGHLNDPVLIPIP
jgi:hypothetical protein